MGNLTRRNEMSVQGIHVVQIFDIWGIDFIGPFPSSFGNMSILLIMDYVSKMGGSNSLSYKLCYDSG